MSYFSKTQVVCSNIAEQDQHELVAFDLDMAYCNTCQINLDKRDASMYSTCTICKQQRCDFCSVSHKEIPEYLQSLCSRCYDVDQRKTPETNSRTCRMCSSDIVEGILHWRCHLCEFPVCDSCHKTTKFFMEAVCKFCSMKRLPLWKISH